MSPAYEEGEIQLFCLDERVVRQIEAFDSQGVSIARLVRSQEPLAVHQIIFGAGSRLGAHPATSPQLFLVVAGAGWVQADGSPRLPIAKGQAAFWGAGEVHTSGSQSGMTVIVLEGADLAPGEWTPLP